MTCAQHTAPGLRKDAIGAMAVGNQHAEEVFEQLTGRLHAAGGVDHEEGQLRGTQDPQPEALRTAEMGGLVGMGDRSPAEGFADVIDQGFQPLCDGFLSFADGAGTEVQPPLHLQEALDAAGTQTEMAAHEGNPGDQAGAHLAGGNVLGKPGGDAALAAEAGAAKALMFGDEIGDLGQIEDLMSNEWKRIDADLTAAFAASFGKMAFDAVHLGFRDEVAGVGEVSRLRAARLARRLAPVSVLGGGPDSAVGRNCWS